MTKLLLGSLAMSMGRRRGKNPSRGEKRRTRRVQGSLEKNI
jgi:hypothetical protein